MTWTPGLLCKGHENVVLDVQIAIVRSSGQYEVFRYPTLCRMMSKRTERDDVMWSRKVMQGQLMTMLQKNVLGLLTAGNWYAVT